MESATRSWQTYPQLSKEEFLAARNAGIDALYVQLLTNRGITKLDEMHTFLDVDYKNLLDPDTIVDMPRAVARIQDALQQGEHITVYGDYDADGVTSSSLLYRALRSLVAFASSKSVLDFHIPHRLNDGCGLNIKALDEISARGTRLIITTDCASSDVEQVAYANKRGIDVIVTDHHHLPAELPDAYAIVNPWRADVSESSARVLCGAGVAFKLVQALYRAYGSSLDECRDLLDLVAIGTIGDIAPLLGENHLLVRLGMERLNYTNNPGLKALIRKGMLQMGRIRERDVAYGLTPRINAAGRMDEASIAFNLLTTESETEAEQYVEQLEQLNVKRQTQTEKLMNLVLEEAKKHPDDQVVVVSGDKKDWHEGILGLVAGRLVEEIHKPVFVLSTDEKTQLSRGSGRSLQGFNIIAALKGFSQSLERYGGHMQAAGFTIRTERIDALRDYLLNWDGEEEEAVIEVVQEGGTTEPLLDVTQVEQVAREPQEVSAKMADLILTRTDLLTYDGYKKLRKLAPFGAANPEPTFLMEGVRLLDKWRSGKEQQNLRLKLGIPNRENASQVTVMGTWSKEASREAEFEKNSYVDVIFRIESSEDESRREVWLKILDVQRVQTAQSAV